MLYGRRDSRYITYHYNNIIIRCCMEGEIVDIELITITRKMVPITGRARAFLVVVFIHVNRRWRQNNNSLPKVVTFFTDYKYTTSP